MNKKCEIIQKSDISSELLKKFDTLLKRKGKVVNPRLEIEQIVLSSNNSTKTINVVQDAYLIAGTKGRVAIPLVKQLLKTNPNVKTITYCGNFNGYGACATAYAAWKLGISAEVFLSKIATGNEMATSTADILKYRQLVTILALGAKVHLCKDYRTARALQYEITTRSDDKGGWNLIDGYVNLDMGLYDNKGVMVKVLSSQMRKAARGTLLDINKSPTNRIRKGEQISPNFWLVAGTSGLARSILAAFPDAKINLVMIGSGKYLKNALEWAKLTPRVIVHSNLHANSNSNSKNRSKFYSSTSGYDDQVWPYVKKYAQNGDFIWNVASDTF